MKNPKRQWLIFLLILSINIAIPYLKVFEIPDLSLLDLQFDYLRKHYPRPVEQDVVLVGIDESSVKYFKEPMTLWHEHLGDFLLAMAKAKPAVVGLDIVLPEKSFNFIKPGLDQKLMLGLIRLRKSSHVVLGLIARQDGSVRPLFPPFLSAAGPDAVAWTMWKRDSDLVVRHFTNNLSKATASIPTLPGRMLEKMGHESPAGIINFSIGDSFNYIPLQQVIQWYKNDQTEQLQSVFGGKPVLLGVIFNDMDRHYIPVKLASWEDNADHFLPGMLLHAQTLRSILNNKLVSETEPWQFILAGILISLLWWKSVKPYTAIALLAIISLVIIAGSTRLLYQGIHFPVAGLLFAFFSSIGTRVAYQTILQIYERRRLRKAFDGVVSPPVLKQILDGKLPVTEKRRVCVLFSDIRGYTTLSEGMSPEEVMDFLNAYYEQIMPAIHGHDGTLIAFMGDGIMVVFGAPNDLENPCQSAFDASRDIFKRLHEYNQLLAEKGSPPIRIGIGLHVGPVVAGHIGSRGRSEYTTVGDTVNTASRLESMTKEKGYTLLCSDEVAKEIDVGETFAKLGLVPIRGRSALELRGWSETMETTRQ